MRNLQTAALARFTLKPVERERAFVLSALGIVGTGLLAIPVLAGSDACAIAGTSAYKYSLNAEFFAARKFYAIIIVFTPAGFGINFLPIALINVLYWRAVLNGIIAVLATANMMLVASTVRITGELPISLSRCMLGWLCTAMTALASMAMFVANLMR